MSLRKTDTSQCFVIRPRTVDGMVLKELTKEEDESPFPALTQLETWGTGMQ